MAVPLYDLAIIGGGINGAGIARDAAGRGLSVILIEQDDLAAHTSSASTKLIHGGLRYLEYREFRLVREALREREILLRIAPHLVSPLRFLVPQGPGSRPRWMMRLGLFLYDRLGGKISLPRSHAVSLTGERQAAILRPGFGTGFAYYDCRTDDSRLVLANALDAAERGATILTGTRVHAAKAASGQWRLLLEPNPTRPRSAAPAEVHARALVNAGGPWAASVLHDLAGIAEGPSLRLVKGSHIVVPCHYPADEAYLFQNPDGRVVFAVPWLGRFTVIGTTDMPVGTDQRTSPVIGEEEIGYLLDAANAWFAKPLRREDIVATWSGVRPLVDDGKADAKAVTRDYLLHLSRTAGAPLLSVLGGKLTTYRRLAEEALARLASGLPAMAPEWTGREPLPGGDLPGASREDWVRTVQQRWPFLEPETARRLALSYGTRVERVLGNAQVAAHLGEDLGGGLTAAEAAYLCDHEWARSAEDILWRRTRLGMIVPDGTAARITVFIASR